MIVSSMVRGRTVKTVTIRETTPEDSNDAILILAMRHTGESFSSLWDWRLSRNDDDGSAVASLYTD